MTPLESIRKRPAMYLGNLTVSGFRNLIETLLVDMMEAASEAGNVRMELLPEGWVSLRLAGINTAACLSDLERLNGPEHGPRYGLQIVVALSAECEGLLLHGGEAWLLKAKQGAYTLSCSAVRDRESCLELRFRLDSAFFAADVLHYTSLNSLLLKTAMLNPGLQIVSTDSRAEIQQVNVYVCPRGLSHGLDTRIAEQEYGSSLIRLDLHMDMGAYPYQICFSIQDIWLTQPYRMTYGNQYALIWGGSLETGVLAGIRDALTAWIRDCGGEPDLRALRQHLLLLAAIRGDDLTFSGSTRTRLGMPAIHREVRKRVASELFRALQQNPPTADALQRLFSPA